MRTIVGIVAAAALVAGIAGALAQAHPTHQGWDSWWHDSWHSGWVDEHGWLHGHCATVAEDERLPDGKILTRGIEWCR